MSSLDGLRVALIGRLRYGHASLRTALRDAGAVCARDVDLQVDVAVVGLAGGGKLARARTLGIPTVDEDTLRSWLDGAPVLFGEEIQPDKNITQLIGDARGALDGGVDSDTWSRIVALTDACTPDQLPALVDFLEPQLDRADTAHVGWTPDASHEEFAPRDWSRRITGEALRVAPYPWINEMLQGIESPKHRLVRAVHLAGTKAKVRETVALLSNPNLEGITYLDLYGATLGVGTWRALRTMPSARHVTHLCLPALGYVAPDAFPSGERMPDLHTLTLRGDHWGATFSCSTLLRSDIGERVSTLVVEHNPGDDVLNTLEHRRTMPGLRRWVVHSPTTTVLRSALTNPVCARIEEVAPCIDLYDLCYSQSSTPGLTLARTLNTITEYMVLCPPLLDLSGVTFRPFLELWDDEEFTFAFAMRKAFSLWTPPPGALRVRLAHMWTDEVAEMLEAKGVEAIR